MNILMIAINDPAGTAIGFTNAINRYTPHTCRLVTLELRYNFMFQKDLHVPWLDDAGLEEVEYLLKTSDVFHFHMTADENLQLGPFLPRDYMAGKMIVHHHHGHPDFRGDPLKYQRKYKELRRDKLLVSTPDLVQLLPEATYQPNLTAINDPWLLPCGGKPESPVTIAHSPTRRDLKNSDLLDEVVDSLVTDGIGVRLELIENTNHVESLRKKRRCHLCFDHLQGYYGVSSLEALSQGLCTISGLDDWNAMHVREFAGVDRLPWYVSSVETLADDLRMLVADADVREEYGTYAREFMKKYWNEQKVVGKLVDWYRDEVGVSFGEYAPISSPTSSEHSQISTN